MKTSLLNRSLGICRSKKALAIPVTFLILFVSTLMVVSFTYYFAVEKIDANNQSLKVSMAQENMMSLDEEVSSISWQSSSSRTLDFGDCGGQLNVQPTANTLTINITDSTSIATTLFNSSVGWVVYELPYSETADTGLFLRGDSRCIVNQSGIGMTQLSIRKGTEHAEVLLQYRPKVSYIVSGTENNKTINNVRIYIINLNSSQNIDLMGEVPLIITCKSTESSITSYNVSYQPRQLFVTASFSDIKGQITVPISSASGGAIIKVELITCEIQIDRWVR